MNNEQILTLKSIRHRFENPSGDVIVGSAIDSENNVVSIKGPDDGDLSEGATYLFLGRWSEYNGEKQWHFNSYVVSLPLSQHGVIQYLKRLPGVGIITAKKIWERYGHESMDAIRENPKVLQEVSTRITDEQCEESLRILSEDVNGERMTVELIGLFQGRGFPQKMFKECVKKWGAKAVEFVKAHPYELMQFKGCGFKKCDQFYLHLGLDPASMLRQMYCAWYASRELTRSTGNTWNPNEEIDNVIRGLVGGVDCEPVRARKEAVATGRSASIWTDGYDGFPDWDGSHGWFTEAAAAKAESSLAKRISAALHDPCSWPDVDDDDLSDHQRAATLDAFRGGCCLAVIGGGPGVGKSYTASRIIKKLIAKYGASSVIVAAPTGKAAVRMTEFLRSNNIDLRARTWHSILGVESSSPWSFRFNETNPLDCRVLVSDETSMQGTEMMENVFAARPKGCHVLLVGDVNQLPPVDHGSPLRDMLRAGVPSTELVEVRRNSGKIVEVCHAIRRNEEWSPSEPEEFRGDQKCNLLLMKAGEPEKQCEKIVESIEEYSRILKLDPVWDCQVIVPLNKNSGVSLASLNPLLQKRFNANEPAGKSKFAVGDKVVNLSNSWMIPIREGDPVMQKHVMKSPMKYATRSINTEAIYNSAGFVYVANGEIGRVVEVRTKAIVVELDLPERLVLSVIRESEDSEEESERSSWDLAYAITVHKSQGSEFPITIVVLDESGGAKRLCDRSWLYTAISRAKTLCVLVGRKSTANAMCSKNKINDRKTLLRELICLENKEWTNGKYTVSADSLSSSTRRKRAPGVLPESVAMEPTGL